jgi:cholesterol oxidase
MGGNLAMNPLWRLLHIPVSVHNLGGCLMADSSTAGVTDPNGEVFGYPGLFVLDGAILPGATGVNPSHTIAAVAERNVEAFIQRLPGKAGWHSPQFAPKVPITDPLSSITIPVGGTMPTQEHGQQNGRRNQPRGRVTTSHVNRISSKREQASDS